MRLIKSMKINKFKKIYRTKFFLGFLGYNLLLIYDEYDQTHMKNAMKNSTRNLVKIKNQFILFLFFLLINFELNKFSSNSKRLTLMQTISTGKRP